MSAGAALLDAGIYLGAVVTLGVAARGAWRVNRRLVLITEAVSELIPNGGNSIKDQVCRIDSRMASMEERMSKLERRTVWRPW